MPGLGDFYASFLADVQGAFQPAGEKSPGIAKRQTWQQQKAIFLEHAIRAAAAHEAEQRIQIRKRRVKAS